MITLDQLPHRDLVFEPDGTLRLPYPGEDITSVLGDRVVRIELPPRQLLVSPDAGGEFNSNASLLAGQPIFGAVILTAP